MLGADQVWTWLVAHVRALLPDDWQGAAGEAFREGTQAVSQFAAANGLTPENLFEGSIELGRRKLTGVASKEHAEAQKNYAEAVKAFGETEDLKIETALKLRVFESDVIKREAEARAAKAAADIAETEAIDKRIDLIKKLKDNGMGLDRDEKGNLIIFPIPKDTVILLPSNLGSDQ